MTDQELAAIRERLAKATPGPWKTRTSFGLDRREFKITEEGDGESYPYIIATAHGIGYLNNVPTEGVPAANAALIANAPTDLAALLDEVGILRGLLSDRVLDDGPHRELVMMGRRQMKAEAAKVCRDNPKTPSTDFMGDNLPQRIEDAIIALPDSSPGS